MRKITTDQRMLENLVVEYEKLADPRLPACSRKAGQLLETCCTIMDMKGVSLWKAQEVYGYLQRASAISQNYYPERLGKLYVINAPWGFSGVFSVVKRFLDPVTVNKIHVLGGGYKTELLGQVPAENLPAEVGGSCHCEGGCQFSDQGPCKCRHDIGAGRILTRKLQGRTRNTPRPRHGRRKRARTMLSPRLRATRAKAYPLALLKSPRALLHSPLVRRHSQRRVIQVVRQLQCLSDGRERLRHRRRLEEVRRAKLMTCTAMLPVTPYLNPRVVNELRVME